MNRRRLLLAALGLGVAPVVVAGESPGPRVAAAADLKFALEEIAAGFLTETGQPVRLTFGSSGNFVRQIEQGAPFDLFLSADEDYVYHLAERGIARDRGALYAVGRIALLVPPGSPIEPDAELAGLRRALVAGQVDRFAIANPEHAPYGRAAEQALRHAGLWDAIQPRLVLGENVSQAAQFALSGSSQGGIIAYSLALAPTVAGRSRHALIPAAWHRPLRQRMALLRGASPAAARFYAYLQSPGARAVMARFGFTLPAD